MLAQALHAIAAFQREIAVDDPEISIREAYELPPHGNQALKLPCFINEPSGLPQVNLSNTMRQRIYTIHSRLYLAPSNDARSVSFTEELMALDQAFQDAFVLSTKLGEGAYQIFNLIGDDPWFGVQEWNGQPYSGLSYFFDLRIHEVVTVGVGAGV